MFFFRDGRCRRCRRERVEEVCWDSDEIRLIFQQAFFEHAVSTSAGSLTPRTNRSSLADFEFTLPTISDQERIAAVICSNDECVETRD